MENKIAPYMYRSLKGVFCVYKPSGMHMKVLQETFTAALSKELGKLPLNSKHAAVLSQSERTSQQLSDRYNKFITSPQSTQRVPPIHAEISPVSHGSGIVPHEMSESSVTEIPQELSPLQMEASDIQYHPLVLGNLWRNEDFKATPADWLSQKTSGVIPMAIGSSSFKTDLNIIRKSNPIKVYRVTAKLGFSSHDFTDTGRVLERASHRHVTSPLVDKVLSGIQAVNQRQQYIMMGIDMKSQRAYELASRGMIRPEFDSKSDQTVIYAIKCVQWDYPTLELEIHAVNERCQTLLRLVHDIGVELRCGAITTKLRRIRFGHFGLEHALVKQQWTYDNVISNFEKCLPSVSLSIADRAEQLTQSDYKTRLLISDQQREEESANDG